MAFPSISCARLLPQSMKAVSLPETGFVLGSAVKHPFDLVTGYYSVHTTANALRQGEQNISTIGRRLHN